VFQWISQHSQTLGALVSLGTLIVWVVYLQLFIAGYRRQRRAKILITRGVGDGLDAQCFVCNMSEAVVYIQSMIVTLEMDGGGWVAPVTDLVFLEHDGNRADLELKTRQGPLTTGELRDMGTFHDLISHVAKWKNGALAELDGDLCRRIRTVEIEVLAVYGSEELLIGARRGFALIREGDALHVRGINVATEQIRRRSERKRLTERMRDIDR
jgi:hypothetical protein